MVCTRTSDIWLRNIASAERKTTIQPGIRQQIAAIVIHRIRVEPPVDQAGQRHVIQPTTQATVRIAAAPHRLLRTVPLNPNPPSQCFSRKPASPLWIPHQADSTASAMPKQLTSIRNMRLRLCTRGSGRIYCPASSQFLNTLPLTMLQTWPHLPADKLERLTD